MSTVEELIARDLQHVWHPASQMKDFELTPPLVIQKAQGSYLYTDRGPLIDAISSWWCKSLGHGHPAVLCAIQDQLKRFEQVIAANTTHKVMVELAEQLEEITGKQHVFFASDGATAVEIAMKLAIHATQIRGFKDKNQFIALKNGYHGETFGTMSVSDCGLYKAPYESSLNLPCYFIDKLPYVTGQQDPLWKSCEDHWLSILPLLDEISDKVCALIVEPIVQGSAGMLCYSADFLSKLASWALSKGIYLISDEIMTGFGRTGKWLAGHHAGINPDLICLSKGMTSGALPLSAVMIDHGIFDLFYADYKKGPSFLHSNTFSGNPLALSAALATIQTISKENILQQAQDLGEHMRCLFEQVAKESGKLHRVRGVGALVAADLVEVGDYRIGYEVYQQALQYGALLRPIGNTLYWLPPLNTDKEIIGKLAEITLHSIQAAYKKAQAHETFSAKKIAGL